MAASPHNDGRSWQRIRAHYQVEKELAARLRAASREERSHLYNEVYDELIRRVPDHPTLVRQGSEQLTAARASAQLAIVGRFLNADDVFLEVGPGDCAFAHAVCRLVKLVYAVDVAQDLTKCTQHPEGFRFLISDGTNIPLPPDAVDVAYSNQMMEHMHPEDAFEQLTNIILALKPGGRYLCITPNRLSGPHDISRYFDDVATGFHLKEYTAGELRKLFKEAGFSQVRFYIVIRGRPISTPTLLVILYESMLGCLPCWLRRKVASMPLLRSLLHVIVEARKPVERSRVIQ